MPKSVRSRPGFYRVEAGQDIHTRGQQVLDVFLILRATASSNGHMDRLHLPEKSAAIFERSSDSVWDEL